MRAAKRFVTRLEEEGSLTGTARVRVDLYGSLALTGKGHGTDRAVMIGLEGETPEGVDPEWMPARLQEIQSTGRLRASLARMATQQLVLKPLERPTRSRTARCSLAQCSNQAVRP